MIMFTDQDRIDWLERQANNPGGILLHDGSEAGRLGLGLRPGYVNRTLREAIDGCLQYERGQEQLRHLPDGGATAEVNACQP